MLQLRIPPPPPHTIADRCCSPPPCFPWLVPTSPFAHLPFSPTPHPHARLRSPSFHPPPIPHWLVPPTPLQYTPLFSPPPHPSPPSQTNVPFLPLPHISFGLKVCTPPLLTPLQTDAPSLSSYIFPWAYTPLPSPHLPSLYTSPSQSRPRLVAPSLLSAFGGSHLWPKPGTSVQENIYSNLLKTAVKCLWHYQVCVLGCVFLTSLQNSGWKSRLMLHFSGSGGSAYLFILHRSAPVVMSSSHSTCGCIASTGTGLCGTAYLFILHRSLTIVTSSSHSTCGCISSVGTGLCGTAYLFVLHRSLPVVMWSAHVTRWCSTSVGTGLWLAALLRCQLGCVGLPTFSFFTIHLLWCRQLTWLAGAVQVLGLGYGRQLCCCVSWAAWDWPTGLLLCICSLLVPGILGVFWGRCDVCVTGFLLCLHQMKECVRLHQMLPLFYSAGMRSVQLCVVCWKRAWSLCGDQTLRMHICMVYARAWYLRGMKQCACMVCLCQFSLTSVIFLSTYIYISALLYKMDGRAHAGVCNH